MDRAKRIEWTGHELDTLFTATMAILKEKPKTKIHVAVTLAQLAALPANRHRKHLIGPSQIPTPLRERFITVGALQKEWKRSKGPELVPVEQVNDLRAQLEQRDRAHAELEQRLATSAEEKRALEAHVKELENRPTFVDALRDFVAESLAEAVRRSRAIPGGVKDGAALDAMKSFFRAPQYGMPEGPKPQPEKPKPMRNILVVGVRFDEEGKLSKHFLGRAKMRYWREGRIPALIELVKATEIVFVNTSAAGTPVAEAIEQHAQAIQEVPTSGDRMRDAIEHFVEHPEAYTKGATAPS